MFCSLLQHEIAVVPMLSMLYAFAQAVSLPGFRLLLLLIKLLLHHLESAYTPSSLGSLLFPSPRMSLPPTMELRKYSHISLYYYIFYHYFSSPPLSTLCRDHLFHLCVQETQPHQKWLREIILASIVIQQIFIEALLYAGHSGVHGKQVQTLTTWSLWSSRR